MNEEAKADSDVSSKKGRITKRAAAPPPQASAATPRKKKPAPKPPVPKAKGAATGGPHPPAEKSSAAPAKETAAKPAGTAQAARKGQSTRTTATTAVPRRDLSPAAATTLPHREARGFTESAETATALLERPRLPAGTIASQETPAQDERTRLVLLVRDPEWLYAYWEIAPRDREAHQIGWPHGAPPLLLRIYDLGAGPEPVETEEFFDVTIIADAAGWYVRTPHTGGHWTGALGYLDQEANFVPICQSNIVTAPTYAEGEWDERAWGPIAEGAEGEALELTVGPGAQTGARRPRQTAVGPGPLRPGASEQGVQLRPGASQMGLRPGASEMAAPGSVRVEQFIERAPKGFWLQVHTELIVYGATEPTACVTIQGNPVRLRPDGTFTLRFALPDGEQVVPVRAVSADGGLERIITSTVTKKTA